MLHPSYVALRDEITNHVHGALPAINLIPLIEGTANLALSHFVATFGGTAEDYLVSHRDQIRSVVAENVLTFAQKVIADLQGK